jgi:hypothetical protein
MRPISRLIAFTVFSVSLLSAATPARAQQAAGIPACDGSYNIIRVSEIDEGMMPKFLEAVVAQKAWYKKAGEPDSFSLMRIIDTKAGTYSTTEVLTSHISPSGARPPHDAAFDAFVSLFRASSTIKNEYFTCMSN